MSRKNAREAAFKLIYERCVSGEDNELTLETLRQNMSDDDSAYVTGVYFGISEHYELLKKAVSDYAVGFAFDRIFKIDLAVLLLAAYEILYMDDIPHEVSVNEALEIAKLYSTEKSVPFINGVLASVIRNKEAILHECDED